MQLFFLWLRKVIPLSKYINKHQYPLFAVLLIQMIFYLYILTDNINPYCYKTKLIEIYGK